MTEKDPHYWSPFFTKDSFQDPYVREKIEQGVFPPKRTAAEKRLVDMNGTCDRFRNVYSTGWYINGRPNPKKIGRKDGGHYSLKNGRWQRYVGESVRFLDD